MTPSLLSTFGRTLRDPVLRRWRLDRLLGRWTAAEAPAPADSAVALQARTHYCLAVDRGDDQAAAANLAVLFAEADRLIGPSGVLREDSTAYHLRLTHGYAEAWLAARRHCRGETSRLEAILRRLLAALSALALPGGLPEIGEVPADPPPALLAGLLPGGPVNGGWLGSLTAAERDSLVALRDTERLHDLELLRADGWLRSDFGPWSGLWHAAPAGWPSFSGHGHQDLGSSVLHYEGMAIFVDPGSPPPTCPARLAAAYRSASAHNGLTLDGADPYPQDRPVYSDAFRQAVGGPPPSLRAEFDGVSLQYSGFDRLGGPRGCSRRWRFDGGKLAIEDVILGTGRQRVERRLITPWPVVMDDSATPVIRGPRDFRVSGEAPAGLRPFRRWTVKGDEQPLTMILFSSRSNLPWHGLLRVEPLS